MDIQHLFAYGALVSLVMLMALAIHPRWLEKSVGGTHACIRWHHRLGGLFMVLSLGHIFLVLRSYIVDWDTLIEFFPAFFAVDDPLIFTGTIGTLLLFILYPLSYAVKLPYKTWHLQHFMMYGAILFILIHMVLAAGGRLDETKPYLNLNPSDIFVLPAIGFLGMILVIRIFAKKWPQIQGNFFPFKVQEKENLTSHLTLLTLQSKKPLTLWQAGDYGDFQFICYGACKVSRKKHPFTVLEIIPPKTMRLMIGAQGDDTRRLQEISLETEGRAFGPHSSFGHIRSDIPLLWIAGGAGLIPFLGLCYHWLENPSPPPNARPGLVRVLYLTDPKKEPLFLKDLESLKKRMPWMEYSHHPLKAIHRTDLELLLSEIPLWKERQICITGPHGMNYFWTKNLRKMGVTRKKIYTEDTLCANL